MANTDTSKIQKKPFKKLTYKLAVRGHCLQCCAGSPKAVKDCNITSCILHPFRLGKPPKEPVNCLDYLIFPEDPKSTIFSVRKKDTEEDEPHMRTTDYPAFIEDDDEDE